MQQIAKECFVVSERLGLNFSLRKLRWDIKMTCPSYLLLAQICSMAFVCLRICAS